MERNQNNPILVNKVDVQTSRTVIHSFFLSSKNFSIANYVFRTTFSHKVALENQKSILLFFYWYAKIMRYIVKLIEGFYSPKFFIYRVRYIRILGLLLRIKFIVVNSNFISHYKLTQKILFLSISGFKWVIKFFSSFLIFKLFLKILNYFRQNPHFHNSNLIIIQNHSCIEPINSSLIGSDISTILLLK